MCRWPLLTCVVVLAAAPAAAQPAEPPLWAPMSQTTDGLVISPDGRYVAYSRVDVLPGTPSNVWIHDTLTGAHTPLALPMRTTDPVNASVQGFYANGAGLVIITGDPLLFDAMPATCNAPMEDCNWPISDVYMVPLAGGTPFRVSLDDAGNEVTVAHAVSAAASNSGRRVAFVADRYVLPDANGFEEVYVRRLDTTPPRTQRLTVAMGGGDPNGPVRPGIAISPDGGFVAFVSFASNLVPGDTNGTWDVFVANVDTGAIERVSVRSDESQVSDPSGEVGALGAQVSLSYDGRFVAFMSAANDLVGDDVNGGQDIFVRDRRTGETILVTGDVLACGDRWGSNITPSISWDGSVVAFATYDICYNPFPLTKQAAAINWLTRDLSSVSLPLDASDPAGEVDLVTLSGHATRVAFNSTSRRLATPGPGPGGDAFHRHVYSAVPFGDQDGDGLLDLWEDFGIDVGGDGTVDLDLPALGATSDHKDLFVEIDFLTAGGHTHRPSAIALAQVQRAFAAAPVDNPDGARGTRLHFRVGDAIQEDATNSPLDDFVDQSAIRAMFFGEPADRAPGAASRLTARRLAFRYVLVAHERRDTTSSGLAELRGDDIIVSLGHFDGMIGTVDEQAGTIMHEYGHALGLHHGGGDSLNCKPNYLSVMSYAFQFPYPIRDRPLDYGYLLPTLVESALSEPAGIGGRAGMRTVFGPAVGTPARGTVVPADMPIDWNLDGDATDERVVRNVNRIEEAGCESTTASQRLVGHDDWAAIVYDHRRTPGYADGVHPIDDDAEETTEELTVENRDALLMMSPEGPNAAPIAVVGAPLTVDEEGTVVVDGSASSDPEGAPITFTWMQADGPEGTLSADDAPTPTFTAPRVDADTTILIELAVHDGARFSVPVLQTINVIDRGGPPAGDAGTPRVDASGVDAGAIGVDAGTPREGSGCACGIAHRRDAPWLLLAAPILLALARRRITVRTRSRARRPRFTCLDMAASADSVAAAGRQSPVRERHVNGPG